MKVLIVVDMQNDFIDGVLGTPEAQAIVPLVAKKLAQARAEGAKIIFTRDTHGPNYAESQEGRLLPVPHCIQGSWGWQIHEALPVEDALVIDKPSFGSLALGEALQDLAATQAELVGVCTDICVISNALLLKARLPELPLRVDAACCAGVSPERHRTALSAMACCQIQID